MEEKTVSRKNSVRIVGFLKENLLELVKNSNGDNVIRGSIIVATSEIDSHKIQFYVAEKNRNGQPNKDYEGLLGLLPENTMSIANYLKNTPTANFATASNMSTKVWTMARFDEFATKNGERETSMILLKGYRAGFKTATDSAPFVPAASFTCDVYIDSLAPEINENGEDTGRALLVGYCPVYDGSVFKIDFIAPAEDNIAKYLLANYSASDTVTLTGDVLSLIQVEDAKSTTSSDFFGRSVGERQYNTKFTRERRICGGSKEPIHQGEDGCISNADLQNALMLRDEKIIKASANKKSGSKVATTTTVEQSATPAPTGFSTNPKANLEDFDF